MTTGCFITIDGIDGSGKTVQTELLLNHLRQAGRPFETISFPQYGKKSAGSVEEYLNGWYGTAESVGSYRSSIFFAVDRYAASTTIKGWLAEGKVVVANRYVTSNMAHQGGKIKDPAERKKFLNWNDELEYGIFNIPRPDLSIILHVPAAVAQSLVDRKEAREYLQGVKRDIHENDLNHLQNAEKIYLEIANSYPGFKLIECVNNDRLLPPEAIHNQLWPMIADLLV